MLRRVRKRITGRTVCGALAFLSFLFMYGSIGAIECGTASIARGTIQALFFAAAWVMFTYLAVGFSR